MKTSSRFHRFSVFTGLMVGASLAALAQPCTYTVTPAQPFTDSAVRAVSLAVITNIQTCAWTAASDSPSWATITAGSTGTGNNNVTVSAAANVTGSVRAANITVGGQVVVLTQRATSTVFGDVVPSDFFFDAAGLMRSRTFPITAGCQTTPSLLFCPNDNVTRGQAAIFLVRSIVGSDSFSYTTTPYFTDVAAAHPYFKWVQKLRDLNITAGCSANTYCPDAAVTRGQIAVFLIRARLGSGAAFTPPSTAYFTDVPSSHVFFNWIQKLRQYGVTGGCTATTYCPDSSVTRGQMALLVVRASFNQMLTTSSPVISALSPTGGAPGTAVTATITGTNTTFGGFTQLSAGPGVTVSNITVNNGQSMTALLTIAPAASLGPRSLVATTPPSEEAVFPNGFSVAFQSAVSIFNLAFSPTPVVVAPGTQVTWTNDDGVTHRVVSDTAGTFDTLNIINGQKAVVQFDNVGTYTYHCSIHPSMTGTVKVQ